MRKNTHSTLIATISTLLLIGTLVVTPVASPDGTAPCNDGATTKTTECGTNSDTTGASNEATAVGATAVATGTGSTALGADSSAIATRATALGRESDATNTTATAVGAFAQATGLESTAVGGGATSTFSARATGTGSIAIGAGASGKDGALASANRAIAIGSLAVAAFTDSVAIGPGSTTSQADQVVLGTSTTLLTVPGDATIEGDFSAGSSRSIKMGFEQVDPEGVLSKLLTLPITRWSYRSGDPLAKHIGPVSEEFNSVFGVGKDSRHVSPIDLSGVAFAAIKGLYQQMLERDGEIDDRLLSENEILRKRLHKQTEQVNELLSYQQELRKAQEILIDRIERLERGFEDR